MATTIYVSHDVPAPVFDAVRARARDWAPDAEVHRSYCTSGTYIRTDADGVTAYCLQRDIISIIETAQ